MAEVKITKVGAEEPSSGAGKTMKQHVMKKKHHTRKRSMKTYPEGILKGGTINGVRDPAQAPPLRKGAIRHTLRIMTEKGIEKRRKHIKKTIRNMPDSKVRETLQKAGMPVKSTTPAHIARDILEGGMEAGMIVVK